ncbi:MAG TPA: AraC family transcriptional regulator [Clostridiales bacterium]|nr:AraC family transcriptional regulator [Clostridiales bacterium]
MDRYLIKSIGCFEKKFPFFISRDTIDGYVPMHQHDFVEIEYTVSGNGIEVVNGVSHVLSPGNLTVLFPWDCHDLRANPGDPLCFYKINLDLELFLVNTSPLYRLRKIPFGEVNQPSYVKFGEDKYALILSLFEKLEHEYNSESTYKETLFFIKIAEILIEFDLLREKHAQNRSQSEDNIWKVIEYIHQNYSKDLSINDMQSKFNMSSKSIQEKLLQYTGMTFEQLLIDTRVRNACARLIYHTVPIEQIARETGFSSEDSFYKIFKRIKGISPANYRKKYQVKDNNLFSPEDIDSRIIYYIHLHFSEDITLADVAKEFHYNENYLSDILKAQTGQSFTELLREIRIFHAAKLLLTTDESVTQIGFKVGFKSTETFLRTFRKHFGCSPSSFRNNAKKQPYSHPV